MSQVIIPLFKKAVVEVIHQGEIDINKRIPDISPIMVCENVGTKYIYVTIKGWIFWAQYKIFASCLLL